MSPTDFFTRSSRLFVRWALSPSIAMSILWMPVPADAQKIQEKPEVASQSAVRLWKYVDLAKYPRMFICPGDLDNDGRMDLVLYREGPQTTPGYMVAVDLDGKILWERGDAGIQHHMPDGGGNEPALRGIAFVYDIDQDGQSEVICEFWERDQPMLCILDGATGSVQKSRPSPINLTIRGGKRSRCHPLGQIAFLDGKNPAIVLKYEASNHVPGYGVALDPELDILWEIHGDKYSMGHVPTIADIDGDGRDEAIFGTLVADDNGAVLWQKKINSHADCTTAADVTSAPGMEVFMSICNTGPAYCLSLEGDTIWEKTTKEVPHGQAIWVANFLADHPGAEAIILHSGHTGDFMTVDAATGVELARFHHYSVKERAYPDFPCPVNWTSLDVQSLWVPVDRSIVDGRGKVIASLGEYEPRVRDILRWGNSKQNLAVQAIPLDICGDARDELILYQPYEGMGVFLFTQSDSDGREKPYQHAKPAYNFHTYF
ncbi:MAG: hypothetical protein JW829_15140 [Pirellulales bacterium]|nr:hypothetical protein [Pirellulales bacterium]